MSGLLRGPDAGRLRTPGNDPHDGRCRRLSRGSVMTGGTTTSSEEEEQPEDVLGSAGCRVLLFHHLLVTLRGREVGEAMRVLSHQQKN